MKTKEQLRAIIRKWWLYNSEMAQAAEGRYFEEQIGDWESEFRNHTKADYVGDTDLIAVSKGVKEGLSIRLGDGDTRIEGILLHNGEWVERIENEGTGSVVFGTAGMDS
jgi:hypothetical protein